MRIAALMACHNRREKTLDCLRSLSRQRLPGFVKVAVIIVDDGSSDGTSKAVKLQFPDAEILPGDGTLYWSGGMRAALSVARRLDFDFYLLLNDDTVLFDDAVHRLTETYKRVFKGTGGHPIIVGSTVAPGSSAVTYGGFRKGPWWKPLAYSRAPLDLAQPVSCDTFNGNCVFVPACVVEHVGNLDAAFTHSMGDIDYGLRARDLGCLSWVAPGAVGECGLNAGKGQWTDPALSLMVRWRLLLGPKGLPPWEWLVFAKRHSGAFWPLFWLGPYLKFWLRAFRDALIHERT